MTYTGGTTGMPKGVMWRQDDLFRNLVAQMNPVLGGADADAEVVRQQVTAPGPVGMAACPLMHGTGLYTQLIILTIGGSSVTLTSRRLDIEEMFDTVERERVNQISIVGDAFAKPMVRALDDEPRTLGPREPVPGRVVRRHVERAGQAGPAQAPADDAAGRRVLVVGGRRAWARRSARAPTPARPPRSASARTRS